MRYKCNTKNDIRTPRVYHLILRLHTNPGYVLEQTPLILLICYNHLGFYQLIPTLVFVCQLYILVIVDNK